MEGGHDRRSSSSLWSFSQVKGSMDEDMVTDADLISTVEFNQDGRLLATGDKGGRVVIFQRENQIIHKPQVGDVTPFENRLPKLPDGDGSTEPVSGCEYNVYSTFQSHEPEFDYLKSLEIEEKINKIKWLQPRYPSYFLITTNDKTIKLWKIMERAKKSEGYNVKDENGFIFKNSRVLNSLVVPHIKQTDLMVEASPKRIYANAHTYHINSISINSDQETFLSADDLRINLWHLDCDNVCFNIVDLKPVNMEDLAEVITASEFHPTECNIFIYSSSKGVVRMCDMRDRALCDNHAKLFEQSEESTSRSFFSEIISSISDVKFDRTGTRFATRDYLTLKVWDVRREDRPYHTFQVHEYLRSKLCSLYESDSIFDKFECCWNGTSDGLITGSYNNFFRLFDLNNLTDLTFEASVSKLGTAPPSILSSGVAGGSILVPNTPLRRVRVVSGYTPNPASSGTATSAYVFGGSPGSNANSLYSSRYDLSTLNEGGNGENGTDHSDNEDDEDTDESLAQELDRKNKRCKSSAAALEIDDTSATEIGESVVECNPISLRHSLTGSINGPYETMSLPAASIVGVDSMDFSHRVLHTSWHPRESILAVAANNNLFIFNRPT